MSLQIDEACSYYEAYECVKMENNTLKFHLIEKKKVCYINLQKSITVEKKSTWNPGSLLSY